MVEAHWIVSDKVKAEDGTCLAYLGLATLTGYSVA